MIDLQSLAQALGGEISGADVVCPGPGHSAKDRSLSVRLSATSVDGFVVHSFAGDDFGSCKNYVKACLGRNLPNGAPDKTLLTPRSRNLAGVTRGNVASARAIWNEARNPCGTIVEDYLVSRKLWLPQSVAGEVLRFHPRCPWKDERGVLIRVPAMVAAIQSIATGEITGVHRTRLTQEGRKVDRRMLGNFRGAAIMLCPFTAVAGRLVVGEGIETCLAAWQLGWANVWALGSASGIAELRVLPSVRTLMVLGETDDKGANANAIDAVGNRYAAAGREVLIIEPCRGGDLNDVIMGTA